MKLTTVRVIPAFFTVAIALSSNAFADFSKSFEGYRLFSTNCFICHGEDGKGNGPLASKLVDKPADLTNNTELSKLSDRELFRIIEGTAPHGEISSEMPKWGLAISQPQINSLVSYIRYLHRSRHPVTGNPQKGKQTYDHYCSICHGIDGKGDGIITKFYDMEPANHTNSDQMNQMSNDKMYSVIHNGTTGSSLMPAWKDTLSEDEIRNVMSYIRLISAP